MRSRDCWCHLAGGVPEVTFRSVRPVADLAAEHPLVEPLTAALIRLLARIGRAAEALRCYQDIRHRLAEELGMDPGPELQQVHRAVLRGEFDSPAGAESAGASVATTGTRSVPAAGPVPAQLPLSLAVFAGRQREVAALDALLTPTSEPAATVVAVLSGTTAGGSRSR